MMGLPTPELQERKKRRKKWQLRIGLHNKQWGGAPGMASMLAFSSREGETQDEVLKNKVLY
eukprot:1160432-Pelagomonas_calceolata.AAC.16